MRSRKWFPCPTWLTALHTHKHTPAPRAPVDLPKLETTVFSGGYNLVGATYSDYAYSYVIVLGAILPPVMFWTWTVLLTWASRLDVYNQKRKVVFLLSYSEKQHRDFKCMSAVKSLILNSDTEEEQQKWKSGGRKFCLLSWEVQRDCFVRIHAQENFCELKWIWTWKRLRSVMLEEDDVQ